MFKISYEKCVCLIILVILAFFGCSGFHIDKMITLPENKKYLFTSYNNESAYTNFLLLNNNRTNNRGDSGNFKERDENIKELEGMYDSNLFGALPLQELTRAYERRRKRRIRNTRSRTHHERHSKNENRNLSLPYQKVDSQSEISRTRRAPERPKNQNRKNNKNKFCPGQDVATRAYRAETVLLGKIRSKTKNHGLRSNYNVTYEVKEVLKDRSKFRILGKNESIRLQFANDKIKNSGNCEFKKINGVVPAQFNISKNYFLFARRIGDHEYDILGPPVEYTRKNYEEVRNIINGKAKVRPAKILNPPRLVRVEAGKRVRLVCRTDGHPPPLARWYKDESLLPHHQRSGLSRRRYHSNDNWNGSILRKIRIEYKRKRTVLIINNASVEDSGRYTCRARGVIGNEVSLTHELRVQRPQGPEGSSPCLPELDQVWCMNGGTCLYFKTINEHACQCAEGFNGNRCENKEVTNKSSMYGPTISECKLGLHSSYYC